MFNKKEYMKQYRKDNAEHIKEYNRKWEEDNPERRKEYSRKWCKDNSEYIKKCQRQRYLKNREKMLKQTKQWHKDNPEKIKEINNRFYQKHREKILKYFKEHHKNHPEVKEQRHKEKLQYIQNYKLSKGCSICGYNENPELLVFHHPDNDKKFDVSIIVNKDGSLEITKKEMDKCIILCQSCHTKLHNELRKKRIVDKN